MKVKFIDRVKYLFRNDWGELVSEYTRRFLAGEVVFTGNAASMNAERALRYGAVFACCRVLAETLASVPIMCYQRKTSNEREQVTNIKIWDILHNAPNEEMTSFCFKEAIMMSLNLGGNSVSEKIYNMRGELLGLYPYPHKYVTIERDDQGKLIYIVRMGGEEKKLQRKDVFHVPGVSLDGVIGISPITYASTQIELGLSYDTFGKQFYENGAISSGSFEFPQRLSDVAHGRLKKDINSSYTGLKNTGKPILLEEGGKFNPFTVNPVDAQLIESKRFSVEEIARIYRVPLHLVQNLERATNNNIEHQSLEFVMYTMLPWVKRIEDNIKLQLLNSNQRRNGIYVEFKLDGLLRGDIESRSEAYAAGRQWGWLSVNDIRRLENMNPIPNGDIYLTPMNMMEAGTQETEKEAESKKIRDMIKRGE